MGVDAPGGGSGYSPCTSNNFPGPELTMPSAPSPSTPVGVADALREARERRGESLVEAAGATRISSEYLAALEGDAPVSAFPGAVYARFFLRQYARHLGLEEGALVSAFAARHGGEERPSRGIAPAPAQTPRRPTWVPGPGPLWPSPGKRGSPVPRGLASSRRGRKVRANKTARRISRTRALRRRRALFAVLGLALLLAASVIVVPRLLSARGSPRETTREPVLPSLPPAPPELPGGGRIIFPDHRVVAFYGAPSAEDLGILGIGPEAAAERLLEQAQAYTFSPKPVLPAFELIGTIATRHPGPEGLYRARLGESDIRAYLSAAREAKALFVIDVQPGRGNFMEEVRVYEDLLREPDVGLALDPEWHVGEGEVPGVVLGSVDAATINRVVDWLAGIVRKYDLPQKLLVIHQFTENMIVGKEFVKSPPELAVTFDIDGFGDRDNKVGKYEDFAQRFEQRFFHGFKLFYEQDIDLMTPLDVLGLRPTPDFVVYQ